MCYYELYSLEHHAIVDDFGTKSEAEQALLGIVNEYGVDLLGKLSLMLVEGEARSVIAKGDDLIRFFQTTALVDVQ